MISRTNAILAVLLAVVALLTGLVRVDYSQPNVEFLPDMKYTPAWEAFAANPNFPNGRTLQAPVAGAIARGDLPLPYAATKEDAVRAGEELHNPYRPQGDPDRSQGGDEAARTEEAIQAAARLSASEERGGQVFRQFCISCHGPQGAGDGPVSQRGFPPPPSLLTGKSRQMKDGQLFHALTYGQGSMAPFAGQLSRSRRWDAINYVRALQLRAASREPSPAVDTAPESTAPESTAPESTAPGSTAPGNAAPESTAPGNAAPESTAPGSTAPGNAAGEQLQPESRE